MEEPKTTDEVQKPVEEPVIHNPTPASVSLPPTFVNSVSNSVQYNISNLPY